MGLRFDLASANWIAYLTQEDSTPPVMRERWQELETVRVLLRRLGNRFYSTPDHKYAFAGLVRKAERMVQELDSGSHHTTTEVLHEIRQFLSTRPWTAVVVPSGQGTEVDHQLCDEQFLMKLVDIRPEDPGLILQLEEPPREPFAILDVFRSFRIALAETANWPGILLWTPTGDTVFLPFGSNAFNVIDERARWIFSHLATSQGGNLGIFKAQYVREFPEVGYSGSRLVHLLHLSDIHLGSDEASLRLPRVQQLVRSVIEELGGDRRTVVPVITGDLMDTPAKRNLDAVRGFIDFLSGVGMGEPIVVLGNHDVRRAGFLGGKYKTVLGMQTSPRVVWIEDRGVGLICLNSVVDGELARGHIGESQLADIGSDIDRHKSAELQLVALMHHHPAPVEKPTWYSQPFYERILGGWFERTDELVDSLVVRRFAEARSVAAILHGHKHIPRFAVVDGIPIFGCGSSVGKVPTSDGGTYLSTNVVTIDSKRRLICGRLLAERVPGAGLAEEARHEIVLPYLHKRR